MNALGRHFIADFHGCFADLNDPAAIMGFLERACDVSGATIVEKSGHHFSPYGVTAMIIISESHLAAHTWPEYKLVCADVFTCGSTVDPEAAFES
ncbi:MAG: adenosylmethionine decarboxylase, partial [Bacteroidota bacterium]